MANETEKNVYVGKEGVQKLWKRVVERDVALDRKKVDKVPDAVAGNIPVFVDGGNISDSSLHVVSDKYDDEGQVLPDYEGNIVTGHAVDEAIDDLGVELHDEIDALDAAKADKVTDATNGNLAGLDASGNLTDSGYSPSSFKTVQTAVSDPSASGTSVSFIDTLSQDENGEITVTKKTVQQASTSAAGLVQLSNATDSVSETMAATPKAVSDAIQHAQGDIDAAIGNLDATNAVPDGHYITDVNESNGIVSITTAAMDTAPSEDSTKPVTSGGVQTAIHNEQLARDAFDTWVNSLIPHVATAQNQLADKAYVDAIGERVEARYLSYSYSEETGGLPFPTYAAFVAAQRSNTFYYIDQLVNPNGNDVIVVTADETHRNDNHQPCTTRYRFFESESTPGTGEWRFEYVINNSALNEAQLSAISSGITATKVGDYDGHLANTNNPHSVTKAQVGLGNVDNTSDIDKPVSTATQAALDTKVDKLTGTHQEGNIIVVGNNSDAIKDSGASIRSYYTPEDTLNPATGTAIKQAIQALGPVTVDPNPSAASNNFVTSVDLVELVDPLDPDYKTDYLQITRARPTIGNIEGLPDALDGIAGDIAGIVAGKADKDADAVAGNIAEFDENGNPVDSGHSLSEYKTKQSAVTVNPASSANSLTFLTSFGQDANGKITDAIAATVPNASTSDRGVVQLTDSTSTTSSTVAATATAVKAAYDHADTVVSGLSADVTGTGTNVDVNVVESNGRITQVNVTDRTPAAIANAIEALDAIVRTDGNETGTAQSRNIDLTVTQADGVLISITVNRDDSVNAGDLANAISTAVGNMDATVRTDSSETGTADNRNIDLTVTQADGVLTGITVNRDETENRNNRVSSFQATPDDAHYPSEKLVKDSLDLKADKSGMTITAVADATKKNIQLMPGLSQDVVVAHQDITGKADRVSGATAGNFAGLDANGNLTDSGSKASDFKTRQTAVSDPTASGNAISFIDTISQNANGEITVTKKTVQSASSTQDGLMSSSDWSKLDALPDASTLANELAAKADKAIDAVEGNLAVFDGNGNPVDSGAEITSAYDESNSTDPVTGAAVSSAIANKADKVSGATDGNFAGLDANGNLADSGSKASDFKTKQTAKSDPTASGNSLSFIDTITQDTNGEITATKKSVPVDSTYSASGTNPVNGQAIASAIGTLAVSGITGLGKGKTLATLSETDGKISATVQDIEITKDQVSDFPTEMTPSSHTHGNITNDGKIGSTAGLGIVTGTGGTVTAKDFTKASPSTGSGTTTEFIDMVSQGADGDITATKKTITPASTETAGIVQLSSATDSTSETVAATSKAVSDLAGSLGSGKADKVANATSGNLAGLDSNGNLTDSGKKASDFATAAQGSKADTAIQGVKVNGAELTKDANNKVNVTAVTGVKGDAESDYRTGQVNITAGNVGAYTKTEVDTALSGKEDATNKAQSINSSSSTDYPSSAAVASFVNSSIATATANFLGTLSLTDLGLQYGATNAQISVALGTYTWSAGVTPTNNDYCFVAINNPSTTAVDEYRRFKFDGSDWKYEYTLNNSSFTQAQWDAINSGLSASDKTAYDTALGDLSAHIANTDNPHIVTKGQVGLGDVVNTGDSAVPVSGGTTKFTTGGAYTELAKKVDKVTSAGENHIAVFDDAGNIKDSGKTYNDLQGEFKPKQTAKTSPSASGNALSFIDTISQDVDGVITATKKSVTVDSTYSSTGTNPANGKAIKDAIDGLDVSDIAGFGAGKTLATLTETDGKIAATFQDIEITKSQVSDFSHAHGNITNDGKIGSTANLPVITGTSGAVTTGSFATSTVAVGTSSSAGSANTFSRGDHKHSISLATGDAAGQVKIAGSNVDVKGWGDKADKKVPATAGNLATLDANGNLADSGVSYAGLQGEFKPKQTAVTVSGLSNVKTITAMSQDADGVISVTAEGIRTATTGRTGIVQLNDTVTSTSTSQAATANAVKTAYDHADSVVAGLDVDAVGGAGKYISAISETDGKISATATDMDTTPTASSTNAVTSGGVKTALDAKVNVKNISLESKTTTILAQVKALNPNTDYARFYTGTDGGSANISDKPESGNKGFLCEAICSRRNPSNTDDYRYQLTCWVQDSTNPYVATVQNNTTAISWSRLNTQTITGVKGEAESSYRTGDVNLTPANLGISATSTSVTVGSTTFNQYVHPTTSGNKHVPSGGSSGQFLGWSADGTAVWVNNPNTDTKVKATAKTDNVEYKILATASASPTSGNTTEAVYDVDITLNPSTNTITSNISGNAATATKPKTTGLTSTNNLNDYKGSSLGDVLYYTWASGNPPAGAELITGAGDAPTATMEVTRTHRENYAIQTVYTASKGVYRREYINGTWGAWYSYSKSTHTHGNITSSGSLQTTDVNIANGDKLVVTDASDSNKVARTSLAFDGNTTSKALTQKGTFESVMLAADAMSFATGNGLEISTSGNTATLSMNISAIPTATIASLIAGLG